MCAIIVSGAVPPLATTATAWGDETSSPTSGILPIPNYAGSLLDRQYISGDWGGARSEFAEDGVQFQLGANQHLQSVKSGGRNEATEYGATFHSLLQIDLQRMQLMPGALVTMRTDSRFGDSINRDSGSLLPANTDLFFPLTTDPEEDVALAITELTYTQFLSEKFALFAGKVNTLGGDPNEFASGRGVSQFSNANFVFNPVTALAVPYSTLGTGALWLPSPNVTLVTTALNTKDSSTNSGFEGFGDGWTASIELQTKYTLGSQPGGQNFGFLYGADGDYSRIGGRFSFTPGEGLTKTSAKDTWSAYWSGWQYLWSCESDSTAVDTSNGQMDRQGIGIFSRLGFGDKDTLPIDWTASGGLGVRGLIPGRDADQLGVGYYYTSLQSTRLTDSSFAEESTQGLEAFYNVQLTPAVQLVGDIQYLEPIRTTLDEATIFGLRVNMRL
jgi:porin